MASSKLDLDAAGDIDADAAAQIPRLTRIRVLALASFGPLITGYAAVAALLALVTAIAPLAHFSTAGVLGAALPSWLAAHQVPVAMGGFEFGALPLLPTIILMVLAARAAAGAADRLELTGPRQAGQVVGSIAMAHGVCGLVVALCYPGRYVDVDPLAAFYYPALVAALAATVGVVRRCGLTAAVATRTDDVAVHGLAAGAVAVALLLTAGAAVFTVGLLTSAGTARELFAVSAPGVGNGLGMVLLSLGYVPNAVIAATAFVAGPGFAMGGVSLSPLEFSGGGVPAMPLLAALPEEQAGWWPLLCLLPLGVGVVVGRRLRHVAEDPVTRMRGVAVAAGVVALAFVLLAGSAGGRLGVGAFDPVTMRAAAVSVALVLWIGVPAAVIAWFGGPRPLHDTAPGLIPNEPDTDTATTADTDTATTADTATATAAATTADTATATDTAAATTADTAAADTDTAAAADTDTDTAAATAAATDTADTEGDAADEGAVGGADGDEKPDEAGEEPRND